jgi:hypothetical protein
MLLQLVMVFTLEATGGDVVAVADTTPYESVNQSEKLYSENADQTVQGGHY